MLAAVLWGLGEGRREEGIRGWDVAGVLWRENKKGMAGGHDVG